MTKTMDSAIITVNFKNIFSQSVGAGAQSSEHLKNMFLSQKAG
jgi:hypothetical protein